MYAFLILARIFRQQKCFFIKYVAPLSGAV